MKKERVRLDQRLVDLNLAEDTSKAKALLMAGEVFVNTKRLNQAGLKVGIEDHIEVRSRNLPFASRGGFKLQKALEEFHLDVSGLTVADIGASNGGFTDCLLQRGAKRVYAIDVGYGQLAHHLQKDPRVIVRDRTNARFLTPSDFESPLDMVTVDASFIALAMLLPTLMPLLKPQGYLIGLIKPQFEAEQEEVSKGGVVRDPAIHRRILRSTLEKAAQYGYSLEQLTYSPIKGPAGNIEFLGAFRLHEFSTSLISEDIDNLVERAHAQLN